VEVREIQNPEGNLVKVELVRTGDDRDGENTYKGKIKQWVGVNHPDWGCEDFFSRLIEFAHGVCVLDISDGG